MAKIELQMLRGYCKGNLPEPLLATENDGERMSTAVDMLSAQLLYTVAATCMYQFHIAPFHPRGLQARTMAERLKHSMLD